MGRRDFLDGKVQHCGAFLTSKSGGAEWYKSDWGVGVSAAFTTPQPEPEPVTCESCVKAGRSWQIGQCNPKVDHGTGCIIADVGCFAATPTSPSPSAADAAREACQPWHDENAAKPLCAS